MNIYFRLTIFVFACVFTSSVLAGPVFKIVGVGGMTQTKVSSDYEYRVHIFLDRTIDCKGTNVDSIRMELGIVPTDAFDSHVFANLAQLTNAAEKSLEAEIWDTGPMTYVSSRCIVPMGGPNDSAFRVNY